MAKKDCPYCEGTGWRPVESRTGGSVRRVAPCNCQDAEHADHLLDLARIPPRYEHCAFENFNIRRDVESGVANPSLIRAKLAAEGFVKEYPVDFGLLFVGPTGAGKTHLAVAVLRELIIRKGVQCLFYDFRDLLKEIQDSYNPVSQSSEFQVLAPVIDAEVLLLDEMASANPSDWVKETLGHIINSRYNKKKVTLITTTLPFGEAPRQSPEPSGKGRRAGSSEREEIRMPSGESVPDTERTLNQFGVTLRSRLYEMCRLVEIHSGDFRKDIKQAGYRVHGQ
ncbi:MAG: ATP-binding protein [Terriglobia bacterium]